MATTAFVFLLFFFFVRRVQPLNLQTFEMFGDFQKYLVGQVFLFYVTVESPVQFKFSDNKIVLQGKFFSPSFSLAFDAQRSTAVVFDDKCDVTL